MSVLHFAYLLFLWLLKYLSEQNEDPQRLPCFAIQNKVKSFETAQIKISGNRGAETLGQKEASSGSDKGRERRLNAPHGGHVQGTLVPRSLSSAVHK